MSNIQTSVLECEKDLTPQDAVRTELLRLDAFRAILFSEYQSGIKASEPTMRLLLLFASLLKLRQQGRAAQVLAQEACVEEVLSVSRTMAEVAINAAYLQDAEQAEIDRYQHFDTQSLYKHSTRLRSHTTVQLSPKEQAKIDAAVSFARSTTKRKDNDPTWSVRTLFQRAEYSDQKTKLELMLTLVLTVYAYGHQATHGSNSSLEPFYKALQTGGIPQTDDRLDDLALSLNGINFVLYVFGLYVNSLLRMSFEPQLVAAGKLVAR